MKFLHKKISVLCVLLTVTGYSFGYTYEVSNETDKTLVVRLVERRMSISDGNGDQYATLQPREKKVMKFPGMWCLKSIQARSFDKATDVPGDMSTLAMTDIAIKMEPSKDNSTDKVAKSDDTELSKDKSVSDSSEIKKAVTTLTQESLCRDRKFTLSFTGKKAEKDIGSRKITLPFDEIIATTSQTGK